MLDVNGMYPYVMREHRYPTQRVAILSHATGREILEALPRYAVIADVVLETKRDLYPYRHRTHVSYPTGVFETRLATESLRRAILAGEVLEIGRTHIYDSAPIFTSFVDRFYRLRRRRERAGDEIGAAATKRMMNALYGKFAQLVDVVSLRESVSPEYLYREAIPHLDRLRPTVETVMMGVREIVEDCRPGPETSPAVSAHVTDYARWELYDICCKAGWENVLYYDTDAIIAPAWVIGRFGRRVGSRKLGGLKIAERAPTLTIWREKAYQLGPRKRVSGMKGTARETIEGQWVQEKIPTLAGLLRGGRPGFVPIFEVRGRLPYVGEAVAAAETPLAASELSGMGPTSPWAAPARKRASRGSRRGGR
jgi:hypothetical protein